jgi:hypothetical protein
MGEKGALEGGWFRVDMEKCGMEVSLAIDGRFWMMRVKMRTIEGVWQEE